MSLAINVDMVHRVLLADGWHMCDWQEDETISSFELDAYEFKYDGSSIQDSKGSLTGFAFRENETLICGPLSSILAVEVIR